MKRLCIDQMYSGSPHFKTNTRDCRLRARGVHAAQERASSSRSRCVALRLAAAGSKSAHAHVCTLSALQAPACLAKLSTATPAAACDVTLALRNVGSLVRPLPPAPWRCALSARWSAPPAHHTHTHHAVPRITQRWHNARATLLAHVSRATKDGRVLAHLF